MWAKLNFQFLSSSSMSGRTRGDAHPRTLLKLVTFKCPTAAGKQTREASEWTRPQGRYGTLKTPRCLRVGGYCFPLYLFVRSRLDPAFKVLSNNDPLNYWYFALASTRSSTDNPFPRRGKDASMSRFQMDQSKVRKVILIRQDRGCPTCGTKMRIRSDRSRNIHTLEGPLRLVVKLLHCPQRGM